MVLKILGATVNTLLPSKYYVHALVSVVLITVIHAFAQGRRTSRERDMHARVILVTVSLPISSGLHIVTSQFHREALPHLV